MKKFTAWGLGMLIALMFYVPASFAMYIAMGSLLAPELVEVAPVTGIICFFLAIVFYFAGVVMSTGAYNTLMGE